MKRRSFFKASAQTTAMAAGASASSGGTEKRGKNIASSLDRSTLAGMSLEDLRDRYHSDLFQEYLPFMERYIIDHQYGGFMCNSTVDGVNVTTEKRAGYEGRGIFVYSFLYNNLAREQKYLDVATKSVQFLMKNKPEGDAMWPGSFSKEGEPTSPPSQTVNSDMYIADGLVEYAKATGDNTYRQMARDIIFKCLRVYDSPEYGSKRERGYFGIDVPPIQGIRILDDWMLFLWPATRMLMEKPDTDLENLAASCVNTIMNLYYDQEIGLVKEILNHDHSRPDSDYAYVINFGNDFQALWHVMAEAVRLKNRDLFDTAASRLKRHIEVTWDDVYGGVLNVLVNVEENIWQLGKSLYVQVEPLVGLLLVLEYSDADWAREWFSKIDSYIQEKFPLRKRGYPLWILGADRKVTFNKDRLTRVGNFHQPRHLMLNLMRLENMIKRKGKIANI